MSNPLTIAVAQPKSVLHDVGYNIDRHLELLAEATADVVVFPELSLTGYAMDVVPVAPDDERLGSLVEACRNGGAVALVGAPTRGAVGATHISTLRIDCDGVDRVYNKMWLGDEERSFFAPGSTPCAVSVNGWRLGLAICKDTGIAEHASATAACGMDVYVASVCEHEADRMVQQIRSARTLAEHGVWVAVASFAGPTGGGFDSTAGRSTIWRPNGTVAASIDHRPGQVAQATLQRSTD